MVRKLKYEFKVKFMSQVRVETFDYSILIKKFLS